MMDHKEVDLWIKELYRERFLENLFSSNRKLELLVNVGEHGNLTHIKYICPFLGHSNSKIVRGAVRCVHQILTKINKQEWARLDESIRRYWGYDFNIKSIYNLWSSIAPNSFGNLEVQKEELTTAYGLLSFHSNGRIREQAIGLLENVWTGSELPFLILRLNDWVEQVQNRARTALETRLKSDYLSCWIQEAVLLNRLKFQKRKDHKTFLSQLETYFQSPTNLSDIQMALDSPEKEVSRFAYRIALQTDTPHFQQILKKALQSKDERTRLEATQTAYLKLNDNDIVGIISVLVLDRLPKIRQIAMGWCLNSPETVAFDYWKKGLLDGAKCVRQECQHKLKTHRNFNCGEYYISIIHDKNNLYRARAILGIGEVGGKADIPFIMEIFSENESISIRKALLQTLDSLLDKETIDIFVQELGNNSPGISKIASRALARRMKAFHFTVFWNENFETGNTSLKKNLIYLARFINKWDRVIAYLKAAPSELSDRAVQEICLWVEEYNCDFTMPTKEQAEIFKKLAPSINDFVPRSVWRQIDFLSRGI